MGVSIQINNVTKAYGGNIVIQGLSAEINPGEFFTLLGPWGCGKTTLLRMIIGFNTIEGGEILVDGKVINNIPTNRRNMGMVFQNYAVFPHMSVRDNVAYGLKTRHIPKPERYKQVDDKKNNAAQMKYLLGETVNELREKGRCHVRYETNQTCLHITVAN